MGWSFRKSRSFGPFRINLSGSGLGFSFGVKGVRISSGKRGTYVNLGVNGIHYRQKIGGKTNDSHNHPTPEQPSDLLDPIHTITTHDVENVTDVDSLSFVAELESKASKISLFKFFGLLPSLVLYLYALSFLNDIVWEEVVYRDIMSINKNNVHVRTLPSTQSRSVIKATISSRFDIASIDTSGWVKIFLGASGDTGFVRADMGDISRVVDHAIKHSRIQMYPSLRYGYGLLAIVLAVWCIWLLHVDKRRKTLEIYYTLDDGMVQLYQKFLECFKEFGSSTRIWQNLHISGVHDVKYHGGASQLVSRIKVKGVRLHKLPSPFLKTNVSVPCVELRNTELYFFPERLIIKRGNKFGSAFYRSIRIEKSDVNFVESEIVAADALVVDHTWRYLNKSGGPDRRFNGNRRLPVCRYSEYRFRSDGGLNEVIVTSKLSAMDQFARFLELIGEYQKRTN